MGNWKRVFCHLLLFENSHGVTTKTKTTKSLVNRPGILLGHWGSSSLPALFKCLLAFSMYLSPEIDMIMPLRLNPPPNPLIM